MRIARELAGFTISEADDLRKAIGKKIRKLMDSLKDKFIEGAAEQNVTPGGRASSCGRTSRRRPTTRSRRRTPPVTR